MPEAEPRLDAEEFFRRVLEPGLGKPASAGDLRCSPDGSSLLFTAAVQTDLSGPGLTLIYRLDLEGGDLEALTGQTEGAEHGARWSPDGSKVAFVSEHRSAGLAQPWVMDSAAPSSPRQLGLSGFAAESVHWCQDSRRLVILAAEEGADQGVASGSGSLPASQDGPSTDEAWAPVVHRASTQPSGWRLALVLDTDSGEWQRISTAGLNVWEAAVSGDALLAVVSAKPQEGDWANSWLELIALDGSWHRTVHRPNAQLGNPASSPDGSSLAVIEGLASDRGVVAGDVLLFERDGRSLPIELRGIDATCVRFRGQRGLCVSGVSDTDTVILEYDLRNAHSEELHRGQITASARFGPEAEPLASGGVIWGCESWSDAPRIARIENGKSTDVVTFENEGTRWLAEQVGTAEPLSWKSTDGLDVSGLLIRRPESTGPAPTVVLVHGGPAHSWRSAWSSPTLLLPAMLASRGYALFLPNPRGSWGRGQEFVARELGDYGGGEVQDLLTGVDRLVEMGVADPDRLGVFGGSHGGYMSCWLTTKTDRFKAAVAMSPVTDWYSQHFSSNIPDFDQLFLGADPLLPGGAYYERSPVFFAHRSTTPTLLTAGLIDRCTPAGQAIEFHQALQLAGVETELVLYPNEGHGVRSVRARVDLARRAADLFQRHLEAPSSG